MSGRKLNALEQKIHQTALAASGKKLTQKDIDAVTKDGSARTAALNFLLSTGMLKLLRGDDGKLSYRAVVKEELDVKKDLSNEEALVLNHIQAAGTEGIWTKHIKAKTELHQTVIDRCLKSLTQKQLVKALKGTVQHPTRKMYILFHLEPSTEVTGGPWYTEKELDIEFIKLVSAACLKFVRDRSFPRSKSGDSEQKLLYPISVQPPYPTAAQVQSLLNKTRITETVLTVEDVETLLNVLVIDGEIEQVPALGATLWESSFGDEDGSDSSSEEEKRKAKKRKRAGDESKRKKKRRKTESSDSDAESDSDVGSSKKSKSKSKSKHKSKKRRRRDESDESESESDDERQERKRRKTKKRKSSKETDSESGSEAESDDARRKKPKRKNKKRSSSSASDSDSDSDTQSESEPTRRSKSSSKSKSKSKFRSKKRSSSPAGYGFDDSASLGGALVYRAVRVERMANLGLAQAPCGKCPVFDFCKDQGPVNPGECTYYGDWLGAAAVKVE